MCCVGTKYLLADYHYVIERFLDRGAVSRDRAVSYATLGLDTSEHMFARDNFQSLLRCGDVQREGDGYFLAHDRRAERPLTA